MNKHESKYFNTAFLFDEALVKLLDEKDYEYITVKEICNKAGVNRSTFYLHYESIDDLLNETIEYLTKKMINYFNIEPKDFINGLEISNKEDLILINDKYLRPYLEFIKDNRKIFVYAFKNPKVMNVKNKYYNLEKYIINPILDKFDIPTEKRKYMLSFYLNGIMGIIMEWIINDCKDSIDDIINIILECIRP